MSTKQKKRTATIDKRDNKKFFTAVAVTVLVLMLLLFLIYHNM